MGTQVERHSAEKDLAKRGRGFNMPYQNVDGNDVDVVITRVGRGRRPRPPRRGPDAIIVANTYRFRGHSMSDPMKYRTKEEAEKAKLRDPIALYELRLREKGLLDRRAGRGDARRKSRQVVAEAVTPGRRRSASRRWKSGSTTSWPRSIRTEQK